MQKLTMESIQITGVCIVLQSVRNEHKQSGKHDEMTHNTLYHTKVRTYETRHSSTGQQRGHDDVDNDCNMVTTHVKAQLKDTKPSRPYIYTA